MLQSPRLPTAHRAWVGVPRGRKSGRRQMRVQEAPHALPGSSQGRGSSEPKLRGLRHELAEFLEWKSTSMSICLVNTHPSSIVHTALVLQ